uniref:Histone H2A n=1 Tax=Steinernema glaseri TaxID=37863 RepID=A0A1I7Y141_9BILA
MQWSRSDFLFLAQCDAINTLKALQCLTWIAYKGRLHHESSFRIETISTMAPGKQSIKKVMSRSARAGLMFPVGRIDRLLKSGNYAQRIGAGASVYLAAVLEYVCAEVLELSGNAAVDNKKTRINPRFIQLAIRHDEELNKLLTGVTIAEGGVLPGINREILPKKTAAHKPDADDD